MFRSTKKFGPISTCHRNWHAEFNNNRDSKKCAYVHGYGRYVQITFEGDLDECDWVYDFGDCKFIKSFLDEQWDHKVLISSDDPKLSILKEMQDINLLQLTIIESSNGLHWGPGMEGSCKYVFDSIQPIVMQKTKGRIRIVQVEIWEHENNSAIFIPHESDYNQLQNSHY